MNISSCLFNVKEPMNESNSSVHRLCVYASGSLMTSILLSLTRISVSFPHLGQYKGNFSITVSALTFILVLLAQTGHLIHSVLFIVFAQVTPHLYVACNSIAITPYSTFDIYSNIISTISLLVPILVGRLKKPAPDVTTAWVLPTL